MQAGITIDWVAHCQQRATRACTHLQAGNSDREVTVPAYLG